MPADESNHDNPWPGSSDLLWWACDEPERPPDQYVMWKDDCPACLLKAQLMVAEGGPGVHALARLLGLEYPDVS